MDINKFLRKEKDSSITILAHELMVLIPEEFFSAGQAKFSGEYVSSVGTVFIQGRLSEKGKLFTFKMDMPSLINFNFDTDSKVIYKKKNYIALHSGKGSKLVNSSQHIKSIEDAKFFLDFFNSGKLPSTVNYSDLPAFYKEAAAKNGLSLGVPSTLVSLMVGEMARDTNDTSIAYRRSAGKHGKENDYEMWGIKTLAQNSSVFSALAFENISKAVRVGVKISSSGQIQQESPIEKAIHY